MYAFVSPDRPDTVTLMANFIPFEEPNGGPNFYQFDTDSRYNIKIDSDGDAKPDTVYQWTFRNEDKRGTATFLYDNGPITSLNDKNLLFRQRYTLKKITHNGTRTLVEDGVVAPSNTGAASMPDYGSLRTQSIKALPGGGRPSPVRPTRRSSPTCGSSTCSTAATCPKSARTLSRATTCTAWPCRCPRTRSR